MKNHYFVFNGDADGICAAHQYYLSKPTDFATVTGVKRDISLLKKIKSLQNEIISVFDIAIEKNLTELEKLLNNGCSIRWFDHHVSENIPQHENFTFQIDTSPLVNTSFLVSQYLGKPSRWAIIGLCGDNISKTAEHLAKDFDLSEGDYSQLYEAGELLNYNGYGESTDDLHIHPADLLTSMASYADPFDYLNNTSTVNNLRDGMKGDLNQAESIKEITEGVFRFPDEKWARRAIGVFANRKIKESPDWQVMLAVPPFFLSPHSYLGNGEIFRSCLKTIDRVLLRARLNSPSSVFPCIDLIFSSAKLPKLAFMTVPSLRVMVAL